jgi:hypothetical protein
MEKGEYTMNLSEANDNKTVSAEAAWEKLQKQLVTEPVNARWVRWSKQANESASDKTNEDDLSLAAGEETTNPMFHKAFQNGIQETKSTLPLAPSEAPKVGLWLNWMKRNRKWLSGTVAVSMLAFTLFTSVGNQALAAILNQFRMEQVTVVQEDDIQRIMNSVFTEGQSADAINKFGTFSHTAGTINGEYTLLEAEKLLNRKLIFPKDIDLSQNKIYISPSSEITLNLHVDEVNKALQRLGAKKLLPQSIDGKPVKLIFGEAAHISKQVNIDGDQRNYSFTQMTAPSLNVDPSIPVAEAMDAVVQFPFLPDNLKDSLKNSGVLNNGNLPMPVIANGTVEKHTIEGVEVVMTQQKYNIQKSRNTKSVEEIYYGLTWVKNGQLYNLGGNGFTDQDAAFALAKELILQ